MVEMLTYSSREEWLKNRKSCIGGSDAACIVGENPWKTNEQLWEEKTGQAKPKDLSDNELVNYGIAAEDHLRELFALDYPQMKVFYVPHNMWLNDKFPWAHASLDGWLVDTENGRNGILEIKTTTISSAAQKLKWQDGIPQNYYIQLLHYFMVTEFDFAILKAQLKYTIPGEEVFLQTKHYSIDRSDVLDDIDYLCEKEKQFAECIKTGKRPGLILPNI